MPSLVGFDTVPISLSQRAYAASYNIEEKTRRELAMLAKDFYFSRQEQGVYLISDEADVVTINLMRPIIDKRCSMLYGRPLVREMDGPPQSIDYLTKVYQDNLIDQKMLQVDLLAELTGSCLVFPMVDPSLPNKIRLILYDATQFSAVGNDINPGIADAIALTRIVDRLQSPVTPNGNGAENIPQVQRIIQQQVWTAQYVEYSEGATLISSAPNELGFLPFVNFKGQEVHDSYLGFAIGDTLRKLNAQINQMMTHLAYMVKMQSGTPIVLSGFGSGETVTLHPGRAINVPAGAQANVLDMNPKIEETMNVIKYLEEKLYTVSNVPRIAIVGGQEGSMGRQASGRELLIRWFPLLEVFREKTHRYDKYELELANMILDIAQLPPLKDINILWPEDSILPLSAEDDELVRDIELNIKTPIDEIMRRNTMLTRAEATIEWENNIKINQENMIDYSKINGKITEAPMELDYKKGATEVSQDQS